MTLSRVVLFSILGMLSAGLSVYMLVPPRRAPATLPTEPPTRASEETPSPASATPHSADAPLASTATTAGEPNIPVPQQAAAIPSLARPRPRAAEPGQVAHLQLSTMGEPCDFSVDGKHLDATTDIVLPVSIGVHTVTCKRNGETLVRRVDVVAEAINPVFF